MVLRSVIRFLDHILHHRVPTAALDFGHGVTLR